MSPAAIRSGTSQGAMQHGAMLGPETDLGHTIRRAPSGARSHRNAVWIKVVRTASGTSPQRGGMRGSHTDAPRPGPSECHRHVRTSRDQRVQPRRLASFRTDWLAERPEAHQAPDRGGTLCAPIDAVNRKPLRPVHCHLNVNRSARATQSGGLNSRPLPRPHVCPHWINADAKRKHRRSSWRTCQARGP
jgi:hypothetical protein